MISVTTKKKKKEKKERKKGNQDKPGKLEIIPCMKANHKLKIYAKNEQFML